MLSATTSASTLSFQFQTTEAGFKVCAVVEKPAWVVLTSDDLTLAPELFAYVRAHCPDTRVMLCVLPDAPVPTTLWPLIEQAEAEALCTLAEFPDCLRAVAAECHFSSNLLATHPYLVAPNPLPGWQRLSEAERRVLRELVRGHTSPKIADTLYLSPKTINNHKANIAAKLNVSGGPYSLIRFALINQEKLLRLLDT